MGSSAKQDGMQQPSVGPQQPAAYTNGSGIEPRPPQQPTGYTNGRGVEPRPPQGSVSAQQSNPTSQGGVAYQGQKDQTQQGNPTGPADVPNEGKKDKTKKSKKTKSEGVPYQGQKLHRREYVNEQGLVVKKKKTGKRRLAEHIAAHVALCLCCSWLCTAPCCCGL